MGSRRSLKWQSSLIRQTHPRPGTVLFHNTCAFVEGQSIKTYTCCISFPSSRYSFRYENILTSYFTVKKRTGKQRDEMTDLRQHTEWG